MIAHNSAAVQISLRLNFELSTVTGASGAFEFALVPVGIYTVTISAPAGYILGETEPEQVTVTAHGVVQMPACALQLAPSQELIFLPRLAD